MEQEERRSQRLPRNLEKSWKILKNLGKSWKILENLEKSWKISRRFFFTFQIFIRMFGIEILAIHFDLQRSLVDTVQNSAQVENAGQIFSTCAEVSIFLSPTHSVCRIRQVIFVSFLGWVSIPLRRARKWVGNRRVPLQSTPSDFTDISLRDFASQKY